MAESIFTVELPKVVYIVGSAPSAPEEVRAIPPDAFVIVCNAAVLLNCPKNLWFVFDLRNKEKEWWTEVVNDPPCPRVFGVHRDFGCKPEYTFKYLPIFSNNNFKLLPGILRGGATIGGCALQFAIQNNCERIYLKGFSMKEPSDFTGSVAEERRLFRPGQTWAQLRAFKMIVKKWGKNVEW